MPHQRCFDLTPSPRALRLLGTSLLALAALGGCNGRQSDAASADFTSPAPSEGVTPAAWPVVIPMADRVRDPALETRVAAILATMSVEQKVGQIIQADIGSVTPEDVAKYHLGSVLNGGNSAPGANEKAAPAEWLALADAFWVASRGADGKGIPVLWGTDAVHGHSNIVGATIFPHNIGLGAANDPDLIERIGAITAKEIVVTGQDWTFAPTLATPRDDRWGRAYEGYSEDGRIVASYAGAMVRGLQGTFGSAEFLGDGKVISTAKHFLGDGGTRDGIDQGETIATEAELRDTHGAGYAPAIAAGVQSVMASYSSWNGQKMHGYRALLTDVLVTQMGFDGFVIGDWNGHGQVKGCTPTDCPASLAAGLDMYMAPDSWKGLYETTLRQAQDGTISAARLDEAVARILRVKLRAGLFEKPTPSARPFAGQFDLLGHADHRAVAREAVRKSLVLLKNHDVLPIRPSARILVAGGAANDMGIQTGGWTISWQGDGNQRADFPNGETIFEAIDAAARNGGGSATLSADGSFTQKPDIAIVVFGEKPYAEMLGDRTDVDYSDDTARATLERLKAAGVPTVAVFVSGRPLYVNPELNAADAFIAAFLPGTEGGGIADLLIGNADGSARFDFTGRLSFSWPARPDQARLNVGDADYAPLFAYGFGLSTADKVRLDTLPTDYKIAAQAGDVLFAESAIGSGWTAALATPNASLGVDGPVAATPDGSLRLSRIDRQRQEDSLLLAWTGKGPAAFKLTGGPVDWQRQANGDVALQVSYRISGGTAPVLVGLGCGTACGASFVLPAGTADAWQTTSIRLRCFGQKGADLAKIEVPLELQASGPVSVAISDARLVSSSGGTPCPAN